MEGDMPDENKPDEGATGGTTSGFTPPATQADLDRIISERLARERSKYADYDDVKAKAAQFDKVAEANKTELQRERERAEAAEKRAAGYEAEKQVAAWAAEIVKGSAIPANALRGSTKDELAEHFEVLKAFAVPPPQHKRATPPGKQSADGGKPGSRAADALRAMRQG